MKMFHCRSCVEQSRAKVSQSIRNEYPRSPNDRQIKADDSSDGKSSAKDFSKYNKSLNLFEKQELELLAFMLRE